MKSAILQNIKLLKLVLTYTQTDLKSKAESFAHELGIPLVPLEEENLHPLLLKLTPQRLELSAEKHMIYVDFLEPALLYRCRHGGGRKQLIARATGLHKKNLTICDISAGLGKDGFILAALGADITLIERSPVIGALLKDGWERAQKITWIAQLHWRCLVAESKQYLSNLTEEQRPQVIYFDPMFPQRQKSALVKIKMRVLRNIVGEDLDAAETLQFALNIAKERVVVKRPRLAEAIPGPKPSFSLEGQSSRFDVYISVRFRPHRSDSGASPGDFFL